MIKMYVKTKRLQSNNDCTKQYRELNSVAFDCHNSGRKHRKGNVLLSIDCATVVNNNKKIVKMCKTKFDKKKNLVLNKCMFHKLK